MAQRIVTVLTDDLDGTEAEDVATIKIADPDSGILYEVDLTPKNVTAYRKALDKLLPVARKVPLHSQPTVTRKARNGRVVTGGDSNRERNAAIREWANANGHQIGDRGRIPTSVVEAYDQAEH